MHQQIIYEACGHSGASYRIKLFEYYLSINPKVSFMVVCSYALNILVLRAADVCLCDWQKI